MRLEYTYTITKSNIGFRNFIKHDLFRIRTDVNSYEDKYNYTNVVPEQYALAKRILTIYEEYYDSLSLDEKDALETMKMRRKEKPLDYEYHQALNRAYEKWIKAFFSHSKTVYKEIDRKHLGLLIKAIRVERGKSLLGVANATGCSFAMVRHYEKGNAFPKANFLFIFSQIFGCSIDELFKQSIKKF